MTPSLCAARLICWRWMIASALISFSRASRTEARSQRRLGMQPWGDYYRKLTDRFGVQWMLNLPI